MGGPLDKVLRLFIQPESEALDAIGRLPFDFSLFARHWGAPSMGYVPNNAQFKPFHPCF
jgi:hypothetical protein